MQVAQVERNYKSDKGRSFITLRDLSPCGGAIELSADAGFDTSALVEGALVSVEGEARGFSYPIDGTNRRAFTLRLVDARVKLLPSISEMVSGAHK